MLGLVLCGGESSRMGSDKGLLTIQGQSWAELAYQKLAALQIPVLVSVNAKQHPIYEQKDPQWNFVIDDAALQVRGPLLGLLSAHLQFPEEDIIVLATDMIYMTTDTMAMLLRSFQTNTSDAVIYESDDRLQPLCGLYSASLLKKIFTVYQAGKLARFNMQYALQFGSVTHLKVANELEFRNLNSKEDLA